MQKTQRILQVFGALNRGGAETMIMNIYRNIDRSKIQFDFVKHTNQKCAYEEEIKKLGGKIYSIPKYKIINHFQYKQSWKKLLKNCPEYKIIHGHMRSTASIYLKIAKQMGLITICHSHSTSNGKGIKALVKKILQYKIRFIADYFLGCSKESCVWLYGKKIANSNRCFVINNAIDVKKFKYDKNTRKVKRDELNISESAFVIGNVGRLEVMKNHLYLIQIFKELLVYNEDSFLLIIGKGPEKKKIKKNISKLNLKNKVIILSDRSDVSELMNCMDCYVMPSIYEGLPLTLVEAQCNGIPCYISNNITKEIELTKNIIRISNDVNPKIWAQKIYTSNLERDTKSSENIIKKGFDIANVSKTIVNFYKTIAK